MEGSSDPQHSKGVKNTADMTRRMVCGGLAGMIAKTATNPLDRIRMLSQTGEHGLRQGASVYNLYRSIIQNEGVLGLWAGNGANLLRVFPAKAVVFSTNDMFQGFSARPTQPLENLVASDLRAKADLLYRPDKV